MNNRKRNSSIFNLFILPITITLIKTNSFIITTTKTTYNNKINHNRIISTTKQNQRQYLLSNLNNNNSESESERNQQKKNKTLNTKNNNLNRRKVLEKSIAASSSTLSILLSIINPSPTNAYIDFEEDEENNAVLSTSTINALKTKPTSSSDEEDDSYLTQIEKRRIEIFEKVAPSVVYIDTFAEQRDAFTMNVMEVPLGAGSGFVWDMYGHVVTNYHVIRTAKAAQIAILTLNNDGIRDNNDKQKLIPYTSSSSRLSSSSTTSSSKNSSNDILVSKYTRSVYKAKVVGVDPSKDIAVLKIDAPESDLFPIPLGTSNNLRVGQTAMAIGNPFGLDHTLTTGVLSGIGREVRSPIGRPISNVVQTDAAVNPGNSGGPLLNSAGKLIGINTAIYSPTGTSAGIGFAIPVNTVKYIVDTLIRDGKIIRPIIGISYLDSKQSYALGISKGVLVLDVPINSPAYKAGMKGTRRTTDGLIDIGDIIIKINDDSVNTESDLFTALEKYNPGDRVNITVNRIDYFDNPAASGDYDSNKGLKIKEVILNVQLKSSSTELVNFNFDNGSSGGGSGSFGGGPDYIPRNFYPLQ